MSNEVSLFAAAGLPSVDMVAFKNGIKRTQAAQAARLGGLPFLRLLRDGSWVYGADSTEIEEGSLWAINIFSMQTGYIAWADQNSKEKGTVLGEELVSVAAPPVQLGNLPDVGAPWTECNAFDLLCISGEDKGTTVKFKTNSHGGRRAFNDMLKLVEKAMEDGTGKVIPIVELDVDSYQHKDWGKTYTPVFDVKKWVMPDDSELAPTAAGPTAAKQEAKPAEPPKEEKAAAPQQQEEGPVRRRRRA